jgi:voltage-gated potassium channel
MVLIAGLGFWWVDPHIDSYGKGLWLAFVSTMTVGYGDVVPTTAGSKAFAVILILLGYGIISLVTASIAAFFIGKEDTDIPRKMHGDIRELWEEVRQLRVLIESLGTGRDSRADHAHRN